MMIIESVKKLMEYVREGEYCSCPFIVSVDGTTKIALFTYYASDEAPIVVYGYGQFLSYDGIEVNAEERDLFQNESDLITINDTRNVTLEQHQAMYDAYYGALQDLVEHYNSDDKQVYIETVSELFRKLIPDDAMEVYRRICPDYLMMLKI